jgi:uncharacterized protein (DUF433 family)
MNEYEYIAFAPGVMGGKPCILGTRVTFETIVGLVSAGYSTADILRSYPYLVAEDLNEALTYAAWWAAEDEFPIVAARICSSYTELAIGD